MIIDETTSRPEHKCNDVYVYITDTIKPGKIWIYHFRSLHFAFAAAIKVNIKNKSSTDILKRNITVREEKSVQNKFIIFVASSMCNVPFSAK